MNRAKIINSIGALVGLSLVLTGIFGPWFSFDADWRTYNETASIYGRTSTKMSPFTINCSVKVIAIRPIIPNERLQPIIPARISVMDTIRHGYDPFASLIGIFCIMGVIIGFLGQYTDRQKVYFIGGAMSISSTLSLFLVIPRNVNLFGFIVMRSWYLTFWGAIFFTFCATFHQILDFVQNLMEFNILRRLPKRLLTK